MAPITFAGAKTAPEGAQGWWNYNVDGLWYPPEAARYLLDHDISGVEHSPSWAAWSNPDPALKARAKELYEMGYDYTQGRLLVELGVDPQTDLGEDPAGPAPKTEDL